MIATKTALTGKTAGRLQCTAVQARAAVVPAQRSERSGHPKSTRAVAALTAIAAMIGFQMVADSARS